MNKKIVCLLLTLLLIVGIVGTASATTGKLTYTTGNQEYKVSITKSPTVMWFVMDYSFTDWYTTIPLSVKVTKKGTDGIYRAAKNVSVNLQVYRREFDGNVFNQLSNGNYKTNSYGYVNLNYKYVVPDKSGYTLLVVATVADYYTAAKSIGVGAD